MECSRERQEVAGGGLEGRGQGCRPRAGPQVDGKLLGGMEPRSAVLCVDLKRINLTT